MKWNTNARSFAVWACDDKRSRYITAQARSVFSEQSVNRRRSWTYDPETLTDAGLEHPHRTLVSDETLVAAEFFCLVLTASSQLCPAVMWCNSLMSNGGCGYLQYILYFYSCVLWCLFKNRSKIHLFLETSSSCVQRSNRGAAEGCYSLVWYEPLSSKFDWCYILLNTFQFNVDHVRCGCGLCLVLYG